MKKAMFLVTLFVLILPGEGPTAQGVVVKVKPGELVVDHPTLINLGFEWVIQGDDNRNARVEVSYRKQGEASWKQGLPLLRLQGERIYQTDGVFNVISPNMFAGSILDLAPDTAYEARFVMSDRDGFIGQNGKAVTRTVTVRTRPEPKPYSDGRVFHVYPPGHKGEKIEPAFDGLMCAYNYYCGGGDTVTAGRPRVKPGDTILVHAGLYKYHADLYTGDRTINATTPFEGTYYLTASGTPERPIAIKGAGDGEVIFDGNGNFNLFNVKAANYNYFEGVTIRNTDIGIWAGTQFIAGSKGLTVKKCRFEDVNLGIFTNYSGSSDFYIADNRFFGRDDPKHLLGWNGPFWAQFNGVDGQIFPPILASYAAVRLYGPGHVVAYNYVADFHDGIDIETYGNPDGSHAIDGPHYPPKEYWDRRPVAIDFYNNYMTNFHDNAIEIDGSMHNVRVMRNMMVNSASHPFCNQPSIGGPIYWIRNIVYHAPGGSTRLTNGAAGVLFYNNTILTETSGGIVGERALAEQSRCWARIRPPRSSASIRIRTTARRITTDFGQTAERRSRSSGTRRGRTRGRITAASSQAGGKVAGQRTRLFSHADFKRSRNTVRRQGRTSTVSPSTTTCSSMFRDSTGRISKRFRRSTGRKNTILVSSRVPLRSTAE